MLKYNTNMNYDSQKVVMTMKSIYQHKQTKIKTKPYNIETISEDDNNIYY